MRAKTFKIPAHTGEESRMPPTKREAKRTIFNSTGGFEVFNRQSILDFECMEDGYTTFDNNTFNQGWIGLAYIPNSLPSIIISYFQNYVKVFDTESRRFLSYNELQDLT